ncbi:hypothetical protein LINPERPRIM_LOCUS13623 [Linum perenne]
MVCM